MSFRAISRRIAYIDHRLRNVRDYPSKKDIVRGLLEDYGEEPSTKTIERDIEKMRDQGAPIEYEPRRHGYYYAHDNWQLPAMNLTEGDLMALMVADRALASYRNSPYYEDLRSVFERLTSKLPANVTVSSEDVVANVSVINDPVTRINEDIWEAVRDAMYRHKCLTIHYKAPGHDAVAIRIVDPLHLVGHRGEWYMLCWSHHHGEIRIYALARIKKAHVRKEPFKRPEGFRPENYIDPAFGIFISEAAVDVAVRFYGEAAVKIGERRWHPDQDVERHSDGSITVSFRTNQQSQVLFWVSQWGPQAEILKPPELRERARDWFAQTAQRYI